MDVTTLFAALIVMQIAHSVWLFVDRNRWRALARESCELSVQFEEKIIELESSPVSYTDPTDWWKSDFRRN